ncbi:MAG TPA: tetratricopeptide repeat protein, partial [Stellaceae bacterium]|nr:tetratricopeptide repeat protein [Stellaceae bacterium]
MSGRNWIGDAPGWIAAGAMLVVAGCATRASDPAATDVSTNGAAAVSSPLGSYLAARHAQEVHDYSSAAGFMEKALADDPGNLDLVRRTFSLRVSEGKVAEAVPLAQRIVGLDGNNGLAATVLLVEDIKAGHYDAALQRTKALPPEGAQRFAIPLLAAWMDAALGRPADAHQVLAQMGDLKGLDPLRELHTALIADYVNDVPAAQTAYEKLISGEAQPTFRVVELAGNFFERHGMADRAKALYARFASESDQADSSTLGLARIAAGTIPAKLVDTPQKGAAEALFDLASLLNQRETMDASLIYARLALELEPNFALAQLLAGEIRDDQGRTADALALYIAVDPHSSLYWSARLRAALALDQLDKTDEAEAILRQLAAERPNAIEPLVELGDVLRGHEQYQEAATVYDQAIQRQKTGDEDTWRLYYDRGVSLERSGRWPLAEADLKHALELAPQEPLVLNYLGYSWIDKG